MKELTGYLLEMERLAAIDFSDFWAVWPTTKGKQVAIKEWQKMSYEDQTAAIEGVKLWCRSVEWSNPLYIPRASTFLHQRRWEEKPVSLKPERPNRGGTQHGGAIYSASDIAWYKRNGFKLEGQ